MARLPEKMAARQQLFENGIILIEEVNESFLENVIWPFAKMVGDNNTPRIRLLINSPGGSAPEMFQLISMIRNSTKPVTADVIFAASAAFMITTQCHDRIAYPGTVFMWHMPSTIVAGNHDEIDRQTTYLKHATQYADDLLCSRTHITREQLAKHHGKDWYMTAPTALRLGVVDSVIEDNYVLQPMAVQEGIKLQKRLASKFNGG